MFRLSAACAALLICGPLAAQTIHKCTAPDGKVTMQDRPCASGAAAATVDTSGAGQAGNVSESSAYYKREAARLAREERIEYAVKTGHVFVGMPAADALRSWGKPTSVNRTVNAGSALEQWVYSRGNGRAQYLYIENGLVRSFQD